MDPMLVGLLGILALLVLLFIGVPIGITMFLVGFFGYSYLVNFNGALGILKTVLYTKGSDYTLTVIPLFVLMGQFIYYSGLSKKMYDACYKWLARLPGSLAVSTVGACGLFSAICGSSTATAATFANVSLPEMRKFNYDDKLATGAIVAGGTLGILIPPSVGFILYGVITETSIGKLFAAGFLPGIVLMLSYMSVIIFQAIKNPKLAPKVNEEFTMADKIKTLVDVLPVLILFVVVIGGIVIGVFTANEGAAAGAFGAFVYLAFSRKLSFETLVKSLEDTIKTTSMIFLIIIGTYVFGYFLAITKMPMNLANFATGLDVSPYLILGVILFVYALLGCLMDSLAMVLLTVPIFFPVIIGLGFDPIWFGVLMVMVMEMGLITPPVGMNIFIMKGVAGDSVQLLDIYKGALPHVVAICIAVIIIIIFPSIALFVPNMLY